VAKIRLIS